METVEQKPITAEEADQGYRALRRAVTLGGLLLLAVAVFAAVNDFPRWEVYFAAVVLGYGVGMPLFFRKLRKDLDARVRATEMGEIQPGPES
ncbi:MAG TPA: hypothetical protein VIT85_00790 [Solirubrobacterales bacterium]